MLERAIIDHASPTLARLKLGSLINLEIGKGFFGEFARLSGELRGKGVKLTILRLRDGKALLYVYRPDELERALQDQEIRCFLTTCGYARFDAAGALLTLRKHLKDTAAFPHEIGVFLGYPLADVLVVKQNDNSYINISRNRRVNDILKKATGLANLDALFLSKSEVDDFFCLTLPF